VITLTLIHPQESLPPQSWTFEDEPIIRIGRASDNHVVLYSAVVSRRHVEVQRVEQGWEIVSLGANGTYINGEKILQVRASDGVIFRLARSGPQIQIRY
jgi:pSer/pThr/pTyr-binding forkhead associated (FHA) protein